MWAARASVGPGDRPGARHRRCRATSCSTTAAGSAPWRCPDDAADSRATLEETLPVRLRPRGRRTRLQPRRGRADRRHRAADPDGQRRSRHPPDALPRQPRVDACARNGTDFPRSDGRVDAEGHVVLQQWEDVVELDQMDRKEIILPIRRPPEALGPRLERARRGLGLPHALPRRAVADRGRRPLPGWTGGRTGRPGRPGPHGSAHVHETFPSQAAFASNQPHEGSPVTRVPRDARPRRSSGSSSTGGCASRTAPSTRSGASRTRPRGAGSPRR